MEIHKAGDLSRKQILGLLSIFSAIGPAFLFYLLVLQAPVVSGLRIGLAALTIPLFAYPTWRILSKSEIPSWKFLFWMGVGAFLLALLGLSAMSFYPEKGYLFYGRHTLTLLPRSSSIELRGLGTSLGPVGYADLDGLEAWERKGNTLVLRSSPSAQLRWEGWSGPSIRLDVAGDFGSLFQLAWDGRLQEYQVTDPDGKPLSVRQNFDMPVGGSLLLFSILWITIFYAAFHFFISLRTSCEVDLLRPVRPLLYLFMILAAGLLGGLLLGIYLPVHPAFAFPDRDSGFFLYAGRRILEGGIPYRDFWDHKGPLIYYLNALGLWLGGNSAAGVWGLELLWIAASLACLFLLLQDLTGGIPAALGCVIFLWGLQSSLGGGNFAEEYCLLFSILSLGTFWLFLRAGKKGWLLFCGLSCGAALMIRPNQVSPAIGIGLSLLAAAVSDRFTRQRLGAILVFGMGFGASLVFFSIYMAWHNALADMFSAVIFFNRSYVGPLPPNFLEGFRRGLFSFPVLGFWIIAGLVALLPRLIAPGSGGIRDGFAVAFAISAAAELFLSNLSSAGYKHYYITWLPYAAGLAAFFVGSLLGILAPMVAGWRKAASNLLYACGILAILGLAYSSLQSLSKYYPPDWLHGLPSWDTELHPLNRLKAFTVADSSLLMWGNEAEYNFLLHLDSPTRFVYQYPLMNPAYASDAMVREFVADLEVSLPVIVDASPGNPDSLPLEPIRRAQLMAQPGAAARYRYLQPLYDFIDARYRSAGNISRDWVVLLPVSPR